MKVEGNVAVADVAAVVEVAVDAVVAVVAQPRYYLLLTRTMS